MAKGPQASRQRVGLASKTIAATSGTEIAEQAFSARHILSFDILSHFTQSVPSEDHL